MISNANIIEYAIYYEILCRLLYEFNISSEIKLIFLSFSIKGISEEYKISGNLKYNTLELLLKGIKKQFSQRNTDFCIIFDCIEELKKQKYIEITDGRIIITSQKPIFSQTIKCLKNEAIKTALNESEKLSDESLMRSIIEYV